MAYLGLLPPLWTGTICFWCANVSLFNPNILFNAYIVYHKAGGLSRGIFKKIRFFLQRQIKDSTAPPEKKKKR